MQNKLSGMRMRFAVAVAAFALLAILAQSIALVLVFKEKEEEFIDALLGEQISESMAQWASHPEEALAVPESMRLFRVPHSSTPPADMPAAVARLSLGNHEVWLEGREQHVAVRDDGKARYVLVHDVEEHEFKVQMLISIVLTGAVVLVAAVLFGSYFLAGQMVQRLERLAAKVAGDVPGPLVEPGMEDELLALAGALEAARARQAQALERERGFAANVSHELGTPLTAIRTDAELIAAQPGLPDAVLRRANRIVGSVDRMHATAASLLVLAREAQPRDCQSVALKPLLLSLWESLSSTQAGSALALDCPLADSCRVQGDPAFVELILRNVLENALRHSDGGQVRCTVQGQRLRIADHGPGFDEAELPLVFERFHGGARGGHGLGLALVRHACAASGWTVQAANGESGGEIDIDFAGALSI
ncbi:MAG: HAMP domain-containing histidine kinase [Azonexus sp.]|nr:HAMP domain-containing histidine kinase [Azonexus sp.]